MIDVLIAIQARSTSSRLPGKSSMSIGDKSLTQHVIAAAQESMNHINRKRDLGISVSYVLLIPHDDKLSTELSIEPMVFGDELDVLSRFTKAQRILKPDYITRLTADCPLISAPLISKTIISAVRQDLDYCSNVGDGLSTYFDGTDTEIISKKLLYWIEENATSPLEKEHVTSILRDKKPDWAKIGIIIGHTDLSHIKLSVDTKQDLENVRQNRKSLNDKLERAKALGHSVFRF